MYRSRNIKGACGKGEMKIPTANNIIYKVLLILYFDKGYESSFPEMKILTVSLVTGSRYLYKKKKKERKLGSLNIIILTNFLFYFSLPATEQLNPHSALFIFSPLGFKKGRKK